LSGQRRGRQALAEPFEGVGELEEARGVPRQLVLRDAAAGARSGHGPSRALAWTSRKPPPSSPVESEDVVQAWQAGVGGVPAREMDELAKAMGGGGVSKGRVSELWQAPGARVGEFPGGPWRVAGPACGRATYLGAGGRAASVAATIALGANAGFSVRAIGLSEAKEFWAKFLRGLAGARGGRRPSPKCPARLGKRQGAWAANGRPAAGPVPQGRRLDGRVGGRCAGAPTWSAPSPARPAAGRGRADGAERRLDAGEAPHGAGGHGRSRRRARTAASLARMAANNPTGKHLHHLDGRYRRTRP